MGTKFVSDAWHELARKKNQEKKKGQVTNLKAAKIE
jgi:hypothetical protein